MTPGSAHGRAGGRLFSACLSGLLMLFGSARAEAQPHAGVGAEPPTAPKLDELDDPQDEQLEELQGPHSLIQAGVRMLAMPAAELCPDENGECTPAEAGVGFGLAALGRVNDFGFGGGITWAFGLLPTEVALADSELLREHARTYLLIEGHFRYYLPRASSWEWWVGANVGGVVINDSFTTLADREPYSDTNLVGPKALTLRTEGALLSLGIGGNWRFAKQFTLGTHIQYANWLLPVERERTPLGDLASLAGRIDVIDVGLVVGALLPL